MTEQRIAGKALDGEVAERVMGWARGKRYGNGNGEWIRSGEPANAFRLTWDQTPAYSTDIAAAWTVVERMRTLGRIVAIGMMQAPGVTDGYICEIGWPIHIGDLTTHEEVAPTAPLAICLAALAAMPDKPTGAVTPPQDRTPSSPNSNTSVAVSRAEDRTT